ncbi:low temperature requirement protein A [Dyella sp. A6]|uniref:low temperature requirement protein A n=1 Tax=Dyella aluminiiresistens TaxID=3069105 RepID=UPI002E7A9F62|nr:low temperature requirement protein A [Dyella sp. A6]
MNHPPTERPGVHHHPLRMSGRDPLEHHRVATPLELLFDLTFATSFGLAAARFAHETAAGHVGGGLFGFAFAALVICWAWVNFSWFSSAYDTDDWVFRVATMVQMAGVLILAIGLPPMFDSIEHGLHLNVDLMVYGYVVMRAAMVFQWLRAARQDPIHRRACLTYALTIFIAQLGWVGMIFVEKTPLEGAAIVIVLWLIEFAAPAMAERKDGGTPWHAHHMAERYSLFILIALGEGVVGTVAAISAVIQSHGWTQDAVLLCVAGMGLTFGIWWLYYLIPSAPALHAKRSRAFTWGYVQIIMVAAIVAMGAGMHIAAYYIEGKAAIGDLAVVLYLAVPVAVFIGLAYMLHFYLTRRFALYRAFLLLATLATLVVATFAASQGFDVATCLVIVALAPAISVIGYEVYGYRHQTLR